MKKFLVAGIIVCFVLEFATPILSTSFVNNDLNWSIETVDYKGEVGRYTSISLDSKDYPHICYCDIGNGDLKYAHWDGENWLTETIDAQGFTGIPTALTLDSKEHPHIAYHDYGKKDLKYAYYDGNQWNIETVDSEGRLFGHLAITIDTNDFPHIAYCDYKNKDLKYAYYDGNQWNIETVDSEGYIDWFSIGAGSIILKDGYPYITYSDENELKYAYYDGNQWNIEVITTEDGEIRYPSMEMDSNGHPHICYQEVGNYDLKYAYYDGNQWNIEVVLSEGYVGGSCSLALDSYDYPHIAYYRADAPQESDRDQEYVYWDGSEWQREVIDSEGFVGGCCDIAIDSSNNPVISYCYWQYFDLKCARKTTNNPPGKPDKPSGLIIGVAGWNITYKTSSIDQDGEQIYYMFDWDDGTTSDWLGPYESGEIIKAKHSWEEKGTYEVRVKAKDIHYSESSWSDPLPVSMPKTYSIWNMINQWLLHLFGREIIPL